MLLNMGPQHPSTHGVLRLDIELDGETVIKAKPDIGFLHTGIEKEFEVKTYQQAVPLTDRIDYLAPLSNNFAYSLGSRAVAGAWNSAARAVAARDAGGVDAAEQPLGVARDARAGYWRNDCVFVLHARTRRYSCAFSSCFRGSA